MRLPLLLKVKIMRKINNTIALTTQWRIFDAGRSKELKKKVLVERKNMNLDMKIKIKR